MRKFFILVLYVVHLCTSSVSGLNAVPGALYNTVSSHSPNYYRLETAQNCPKQLKPMPLTSEQLKGLADELRPKLQAQFESQQAPAISPGVSLVVTYRDQPLLFFSAGVRDVISNEPVTSQTLFQCGSISKSFTSALAHVAIERGQLESMDDKITKYVPEFSVINPFDPKALPTTTFRQLATHLSGLQRESPCPFGICNILNAVKNIMLIRQPNSYPSYSNLGYSLLGHIVAEKIMGQPFAEAVDTYVLKPLNMPSSGFLYPPDVINKLAHGHVWSNALPITDPMWNAPTGSMYTNAVDIANALMRLMRRDYPTRIFKTDTIWNEFFLPMFWNADNVTGFGAPWEIKHRDSYLNLEKGGALSGLNAHFSMIPQLELGVAVFSNGGYPSPYYANTVFEYIMPKLEDMLMPLQPYFDTPVNATNYVGKYLLEGTLNSFANIFMQFNALLIVVDIIPNRMALVKPDSAMLHDSAEILQLSLPPDLIPCMSGELLGFDKQYVQFVLGADGKAVSFKVPGLAYALNWNKLS